jgi:hypothetical protein
MFRPRNQTDSERESRNEQNTPASQFIMENIDHLETLKRKAADIVELTYVERQDSIRASLMDYDEKNFESCSN